MVKTKKDKHGKRLAKFICKVLFFGLIGNFVVFQLFDLRFMVKPLNILAFGLFYYLIERLIKLLNE